MSANQYPITVYVILAGSKVTQGVYQKRSEATRIATAWNREAKKDKTPTWYRVAGRTVYVETPAY